MRQTKSHERGGPNSTTSQRTNICWAECLQGTLPRFTFRTHHIVCHVLVVYHVFQMLSTRQTKSYEQVLLLQMNNCWAECQGTLPRFTSDASQHHLSPYRSTPCVLDEYETYQVIRTSDSTSKRDNCWTECQEILPGFTSHHVFITKMATQRFYFC